MQLNELIKILQLSWNENNNMSEYSAVIALIANDFLGGKIIKCIEETEVRYYNLVNNDLIDFTSLESSKICDYTKCEEITKQDLISNQDIKKKYRLFLNKVKDNFIKYGTKKYKLLDINGQYFSKVPGTCGGNKKLKIYGKLDCPSALKYLKQGYYKDNRVFFESVEIAEKLGYRPCGKCMRKEYEKWKENNCK